VYHGFYLQLLVDEQYLQQLAQQLFLDQPGPIAAKPTDRPEATTEAADTIGFISFF
jgi:hypothetical protein